MYNDGLEGCFVFSLCVSKEINEHTEQNQSLKSSRAHKLRLEKY